MYGGRFLTSKMEACSAQRLDVKLRAAGRRRASSGAPLAAHPIMPVQAARRRANSRRGSRLGRREKRRRTVNFNDELGGREEACWIAHNDWIHCYESQLMFNGLAYQHSIERILVILRQSRKTRNGSFVERERFDAVNVTLFY